MDKQTTHNRFFAGVRTAAAGIAAASSLFFGVAPAFATDTAPQLNVPLCVDPTKVGGADWGQVGSMTAKGDGVKVATSFDVAFTSTRVQAKGGSASFVLYATATTFSNPIGSGRLAVDKKTGLVKGIIQLYGPLDLTTVDLTTDTFRVEGEGLTPSKGILDCVS